MNNSLVTTQDLIQRALFTHTEFQLGLEDRLVGDALDYTHLNNWTCESCTRFISITSNNPKVFILLRKYRLVTDLKEFLADISGTSLETLSTSIEETNPRLSGILWRNNYGTSS